MNNGLATLVGDWVKPSKPEQLDPIGHWRRGLRGSSRPGRGTGVECWAKGKDAIQAAGVEIDQNPGSGWQGDGIQIMFSSPSCTGWATGVPTRRAGTPCRRTWLRTWVSSCSTIVLTRANAAERHTLVRAGAGRAVVFPADEALVDAVLDILSWATRRSKLHAAPSAQPKQG